MSRRTWTAADPEPDDHPDLADDLGEVWLWENDPMDYRCACGGHTCSLDETGWWSPMFGGPHTWADIFTLPRTHTPCATAVTELTADESRELCSELFS